MSTQGDARHTGQGIYRTTDGGKTWENTLRAGERERHARPRVRVRHAERDVRDERRAARRRIRRRRRCGGGWCAAAASDPNGTALFKSTDEGKTWTKVDTLPPYTGRISVAVAMHTNGQRVYVVGGALQGGSGLYRSDDQGATWQHMAGDDTRVGNGQGAYSSGVWVDSQNPDILYTVSTTVYRSTDGGKTFIAFKGAPGGEDPHDIWIDPTNGQRMLFGVDQGPAVTLDGGKTWSGYYQIPIAQIYHVATDTRYPYWVMGSQQDTGAIMTRSRSDQGQITIVDWLPLPSSEFGTVVPDPLKPTTVYGVGYGAGQGNGMIKIDLATGQWGNVAPNFGADSDLYAAGRDFWKRFDTAFDPKAMYVGYNCLLVTRDGAQTWKAFSPDLTTPKGQPMVPCGVRRQATAWQRGCAAPRTPRPRRRHADSGTLPARRGGGGAAASISDFSISTVKQGVVWSGSSNGQIYNTMDGGKTWNNVTNFTDLPRERELRHGRGRTQRRQHGLRARERRRRPRRRRPAARRRRAALHLSHARRRQDLDAHRQRPAGRRAHRQPGARHPRGSETEGLALRRHRDDRLTCRSTMAITGSRCGSICRARRSATWCSTPTIT